jgi:hypothetical protein
MGDMLSARQAAGILGCSPDDVLIYRHRGSLRGYRHKTRLWRFRRVDVEKLADEIRDSSTRQQGNGSWKGTVTTVACVYSGPGDTHRFEGLIQKGTAVLVIEERNGWCAFVRELGKESKTKVWIQQSTLSRNGLLP